MSVHDSLSVSCFPRKKLSADVCLYVHAVGRIKPNYVSLSVLTVVLCGVSCRFLAFGVH